jgi:hypothetical protein
MRKFCTFVWLSALSVVFMITAALPARASVSLLFSDNNHDLKGTTTTTTVTSGVTAVNVPVTLVLTTTTNNDNVVSANFLLQTDHLPAVGAITITSRNFTATNTNGLAASSFDASQSDSTLGMPGLALNPKSNLTSGGQTVSPGAMGGSTSPGVTLNGVGGSFVYAEFLLTIAANTSPGTYNITSVDSTWGNSSFTDSPFLNNATYTINVVPEPTGLAAVAGAGWLFVSLRRRCRRRPSA